MGVTVAAGMGRAHRQPPASPVGVVLLPDTVVTSRRTAFTGRPRTQAQRRFFFWTEALRLAARTGDLPLALARTLRAGRCSTTRWPALKRAEVLTSFQSATWDVLRR